MKKESYRTISFMNTDVNILSKIPAGKIAKTISKKKKAGKHTIRFQELLQNYSNQNIMALAKVQIHRSVEQNRESTNRPKFIRSIDL